MSEVLDFFYNNPLPKKAIHPRKISIDKNQNTLIIAPPKHGKSSLLLECAQNLAKKSFLYLDLNDTRVSFEQDELHAFCKTNSIQTLLIDNYYYNFELPKNCTLIISSEYDQNIAGFEKLYLKGLDFEEFIYFSKSKDDPSHLFGSYVKSGVLPELSLLNDISYIKRAQEIPKLITKSPQEEDVLRFLFSFLGSFVTTNHIFTLYKKEEKISKDRFYEIIKNFKDRGIIYLVPQEGKESGGKLYFFDYGVKNANTIQKDFGKTLQNLLFLELNRRYERFTHTSWCDFYIEEENNAYISMPFINKEKIKSIPQNIDQTHILTNGYYEKISHNITALPFWEWLAGE